MKFNIPTILSFLIILLNAHSIGAQIDNFNSRTTPAPWYANQSVISIQNPSSDGTNYLEVADGISTAAVPNGAGWAVLDIAPSVLLNALNSNNSTLCFDFKVIDDKGSGLDFHPRIGINPASSTVGIPHLIYESHTPVKASDPRVPICAPLWSCSAGYPSNLGGQWYIGAGFSYTPVNTPAKWQALHSALTNAALNGNNSSIIIESNYYNGAAGRLTPAVNLLGETVGVDNIALNTASPFSHSLSLGIPNNELFTCDYPITFTPIFTTNMPAGTNYSYKWIVDGVEKVSATAAAVAAYTLTATASSIEIEITDPNGCVVSNEVAIAPTGFVIRGKDYVSCSYPLQIQNAGATGIPWITLGLIVDRYEWSTGETTWALIVNGPGTYNLTAWDSENCSANADVNVTLPPSLSVDAGPDVHHCSLTTHTLQGTITSPSGSTYSYQWLKNGTALSPAVTTTSYTVSESGTYTLEAIDAHGCTYTDDVVVLLDKLHLTTVPDISTCSPSETVVLDISSESSVPINVKWYAQNDPLQTALPGSATTITGPCPAGTPCATSDTFNSPLPLTAYVVEIEQGSCVMSTTVNIELNELSVDLQDVATCDFPNYSLDPTADISYGGNFGDLSFTWTLPDLTTTTQYPLIINTPKFSTEIYHLNVTVGNCSVDDDVDVVHNCDPCIEIENGEPIFQKRHYSGNSLLTPRSTVVRDDLIYTISEVFNEPKMVLTTTTLEGELLSSWQYTYTINPSDPQVDLIETKDIWVNEEDIYILGNLTSRNMHQMTGVFSYGFLAKMDKSSGTLLWINVEKHNMNVYNAFSPTYDNGNVVDGFIITGSSNNLIGNDWAPNQDWAMAFVAAINTTGQKLYYKMLDFDIPCSTCLGGVEESTFGYDISKIIDINNYKYYAILVNTRHRTHPDEIGHLEGEPSSFTFLLVDKNGSIKSTPSKLWKSTNGMAHPNKIHAKKSGNLPADVYIFGHDYGLNESFYFSANENYLMQVHSKYDRSGKFLDVIQKNNDFTVHATDRWIDLDISGNISSMTTKAIGYHRLGTHDYAVESDMCRSNRGHIFSILGNDQGIGVDMKDAGIKIFRTTPDWKTTCMDWDVYPEASPWQLTENQVFDFSTWSLGMDIDAPFLNFLDIVLNTDCCFESTYTPIFKNYPPDSSALNIPKQLIVKSVDDIEYNLAPNPNSGTFQINNSGSIAFYDQVRVVSTTGRVIFQQSGINSTEKYDMTTYPAGLYFVEVVNGQKSKRLKMILR